MSESLLSVRDLSRIFGVSRRTIWKWLADGVLPKPIRIGPRLNRWTAASVQSLVSKLEACNGQ